VEVNYLNQIQALVKAMFDHLVVRNGGFLIQSAGGNVLDALVEFKVRRGGKG
jgi:hypothetical protein